MPSSTQNLGHTRRDGCFWLQAYSMLEYSAANLTGWVCQTDQPLLGFQVPLGTANLYGLTQIMGVPEWVAVSSGRDCEYKPWHVISQSQAEKSLPDDYDWCGGGQKFKPNLEIANPLVINSTAIKLSHQ